MKQITLNIPEGRFKFFMELILSLGFVEVQEPVTEVTELSEEEKKELDLRWQRAQSNGFKDCIEWKELKSQLKKKHGI